MNQLKILPFPDSKPDYIVGIDPYGYDGRVSSFCVVKRPINSDGMEIVASYSSSDKDLYKKQLQDIMALYNIANENVIDFSNKTP